MFKSVVCILAGVWAAASLQLRSEVLIDSNFQKNAGLWYAIKNSGQVSCDPSQKLLTLQNNNVAIARIANWKQLTASMIGLQKLKLTAEVKGSGELTGVFVLTVQSASGGRSYPRHAGPTIQLTDEFQNFEFTLDLTDSTPIKAEPRFELKGSNARAIFRRIKCESIAPAVSAAPPQVAAYTALAVNSPDPVIKVKSTPQAELKVLGLSSDGSVLTMPPADHDGNVQINIPRQLLQKSGLFKLTVAANGSSSSTYLQIIEPEKLLMIKQLAAKCQLKRPSSVLVLGDSLSDFDRGFNWIDQLNCFLNQDQRQPEIRFCNFGIGGDDIKRVSRRLTHFFQPSSPTEYFQKRYNKIAAQKYDYIIIFLGQNDTKSSSQSQYSQTFVPQDKWRTYWEQLLNLLKKQFPAAEIFICSPIHTDTARQDQLAEIILRKRPNVWKFGIEKYMLAYSQLLQQLAADPRYKARYIDLYTPSTARQKILFKSEDGVHLNFAGQQFILKTILENLH